MPRVGWLLVVLATAAGVAAAAAPRPPLAPAVAAVVDAAPADDPFPIRRVRGANARLPELLKELEPGPAVRLPRDAFESRVRAAGRAAASVKLAPKLADATYTAEFDGTDLIGTAELGVLNAHGATGFVPLDPLRVAVRSAKWADGRSAVLAVRDGAPAVWVDRPGRTALQLNWSLAGTTEPGERRFELRVPPCPTAALELNLPADRVPSAATDVLLTGPFEVSGRPGRRAWRLRFGGRAKVEFAVRPATPSGVAAQARLVARYEIQPGQLVASFEYDLRPARGSASEWTFTADPGLRVVDVVTNNRAGWVADPPAVSGGPRRVRVALRQPAPGGKVLVTAVAPFPDPVRGADAPLPAVRPLGAVLDDERVEVRLAAGLKVDSWSTGDYRLTDAAAGTDPARALALVGTLLAPGADEPYRRMPSLRVAASDAEFTTFERLEWHLAPDRSALAARVTVRVRRGPLFHLAVRPPPGYALDRGEAGADELLSHVGPLVGGQRVLEFARPLATGQTAELRLEYRAPAAPGEPRPFPAFVVPGAAERDGWLSVTADPARTVTTHPGAGAIPGGIWGWLATDARPDARALYLFRGREPDGTAMFGPSAAPAVTETVVRVSGDAGGWVARTRIALAAPGAPTAVVFVPGPRDGRTWKLADTANAVADAAPVPRELLALAALLPPVDRWAAVAGAPVRPDGTFWVVRFARPLAGPTALETTAGPAGGAPVPVPRLVGAKPTVRVEVAPESRAEAELVGDFVRVRAARAPESARVVSDAYLVTAVRGPGAAVAAFGGTVRDGRGEAVRLALPPGAELRGVCVAGRWLPPGACADREPDGRLRVPVPPGAAVRFEVRYRLAVGPGWPTRRIDSPVPDVAGGPEAVTRWWTFSADVLPGLPALVWGRTGDEPPLLGGPLGDDAPAVVLRAADGDWVRVGEARTADAVACALSTGLLLVGLVAGRRQRVRGVVVLAACLAGALGVVELGPPWWVRAAWPPLCAATVALAGALVAVAVVRRAPVSALAAALLFLIPALVATGQPSAPVTVLVVAADGGEEVIAARATLDRLDTLARPAPPMPVVTSATYDVRVDDSGARVTARLVAHAFRERDNVLALLMPDARLERATVDGVPAFPSSPAANTLALAIGAAGRHEIELRFAAAVTANGADRDLRFGVPDAPESRLSASLPGAARQPVVTGAIGRQVTTVGGDRAAVEADLGAVKGVHVRWREGAGGAATVKVREACVWDVTETGADLTAAYLVRVEQGALPGLRFEVPAELEVLRVAARALDPTPGPLPLRDWSLSPEKAAQRLRVDFQTPVSGRLLVVVEYAPRRPISRQPVLRFPRVSFGAVAGETDAVYGLRSSRVQLDGVGLGGVIDFPSDPLKDFAAVPDLRLDPLGAVRAFKPGAGGAAELRPVLRVGEPPAVRTATAWHVGPGRADGSGAVSWQAKEPLPLIEFGLPGVRVLEVRGPDVLSWNQSGGRVQVWLRGAPREGAVEWVGTAVSADGAFDPAHPLVSSARHAGDEVRVRAVAGWAVRADRSRGWQSVPAAGALRFVTDLPAAPPIRVQLVPVK